MWCGRLLELADERGQPVGRQRPAQLGEPQREQVHRRDLADERLRRGDADLEPGAREEDAVGVARDLRAHHVRDAEHGRAARAREPHRRERVGRLARLRDADHEVARADDRVAVAVLGGDVHLDRHARPLLDRVAADQARVVGGAAGDDRRCARTSRRSVVVDRAEVAEVDAVAARRAVGDRLGDRVRLLVDLLEHERLVAALLGGLRVPVDLDDLALDRRAVGRRELDAVGRSTTISPSSMYWTRRVRARKAGTAEARNCSPSPRPTTSGHSSPRADEHARLVDGHRDEREVADAARRRRRARPPARSPS